MWQRGISLIQVILALAAASGLGLWLMRYQSTLMKTNIRNDQRQDLNLTMAIIRRNMSREVNCINTLDGKDISDEATLTSLTKKRNDDTFTEYLKVGQKFGKLEVKDIKVKKDSDDGADQLNLEVTFERTHVDPSSLAPMDRFITKTINLYYIDSDADEVMSKATDDSCYSLSLSSASSRGVHPEVLCEALTVQAGMGEFKYVDGKCELQMGSSSGVDFKWGGFPGSPYAIHKQDRNEGWVLPGSGGSHTFTNYGTSPRTYFIIASAQAGNDSGGPDHFGAILKARIGDFPSNEPVTNGNGELLDAAGGMADWTANDNNFPNGDMDPKGKHVPPVSMVMFGRILVQPGEQVWVRVFVKAGSGGESTVGYSAKIYSFGM